MRAVRALVAAALSALVALAIVAGWSAPSAEAGERRVESTATRQARAMLAVLKTANPSEIAVDYDRTFFPQRRNARKNGWVGVGARCDSVEAALIRAGTRVFTDGKCRATQGVWTDRYTKENMGILGSVTHVVPLEYAWVHGATKWNDEMRERFANAPENLVVMDDRDRDNNQRSLPAWAVGRGGPSDWAPSQNMCKYAKDWIRVLAGNWGGKNAPPAGPRRPRLSLGAKDKAALSGMLDTCPRVRG